MRNEISCIIQARMGSSRLTGKVLMSLDGKNSVLYYTVNQLKHSKLIDRIIIATTTLHEDDKIIEIANEMNVQTFRGSTTDLLDRYYKCAKEFSLTNIVRITSDNPLIDPTLVDQAIEKFSEGSFDYVTNFIPRTFPQGTETEVFSSIALEKAWKEAKKPSEREHVTPYFYNNPNKFKILKIKHPDNLSKLRWTVDQEPDLELVRAIISKIKKRPILMKDIISLLENEPELVNINKDYVMNEGYLKSIKEDNPE